MALYATFLFIPQFDVIWSITEQMHSNTESIRGNCYIYPLLNKWEAIKINISGTEKA